MSIQNCLGACSKWVFRRADGCDRSSETSRKRGRPMSKKSLSLPTAAAVMVNVAPVRVRLKTLNCNQAVPYPRDGQTREWWHRLQNAFGTASGAFVAASLQQLV